MNKLKFSHNFFYFKIQIPRQKMMHVPRLSFCFLSFLPSCLFYRPRTDHWGKRLLLPFKRATIQLQTKRKNIYYKRQFKTNFYTKHG